MAQPATSGVLLDHVQDKIVLLDEAGQITYVNDAVTQTFGYEPAEIEGTDAFEYIHPDDVAAAERTFTQTIDADSFTESTVKYRFRASDGSWVWLESRMSNLTDAALDGYVVSSRDISNRVAAERDKQETATRLEELAAVASDVLWMFNADWSELLFVNPAYEDVYGKPVEEIKADPSSFIDTVHPDDVARVEGAMERLSEGVPVNMEYRVNPEHGYDVWVWVQAEPIAEDGEVVRITGFTRDITDRQRRKQQLCVMDKLLRHNLRNDLTTILGQAELIDQTVPEVSERVAVIRRTGEELLESAEKQREIIDLLTNDVAPTRIDLRDIVDQSADVVATRFPAASVSVSGPASVPVEALPQVQLSITELIENAIHHSAVTDPSVRITLKRYTDCVAVIVQDDGPPIPANEMQVLTGKYEMNDVYHSTGLGLWLVSWMVELMDGEISVDTDGRGNRIRLELPRDSD